MILGILNNFGSEHVSPEYLKSDNEVTVEDFKLLKSYRKNRNSWFIREGNPLYSALISCWPGTHQNVEKETKRCHLCQDTYKQAVWLCQFLA